MEAQTMRLESWEQIQEMMLATGTRGTDPSWFGKRDHKQLVDAMRKGDPESVEEARKQFDRGLEAVLPSTEGGKAQSVADFVGHAPIVGAALSGHPKAMRRRKRSPTLGPIRIFVDCACNAAIAPESMLKRGIAITALAYAIQTLRPIELYWCSIGVLEGGIPIRRHMTKLYRVGLAPLDLNRVAIIMSDVGIVRRLFQWGLDKNGKPIDLEKSKSYSTHRAPDVPQRELLGCGPDDIYIERLTFQEEDNCNRDPMGWLLRSLAKNKENSQAIWGAEER